MNIENHMVIGNDNETDCDYKLVQENEIAFDNELRDQLEQISQSGELHEYFPLLKMTRLHFYMSIREELGQLEDEYIAAIAEGNTALTVAINRSAVERVKQNLKEEAEK